MIKRYQQEAEFYSKQAETVAKKFNNLEQQLAEKDLKIMELQTKLNLKDKETDV